MEQEQSVFEMIGQYIVDSIEEQGWQKALLYLEVAEQSVGLRGQYITENGTERPFDAEGDFNLAKAILEFHRLSNENLRNRWNRATATLTASYELTLEYNWNQELYDEVAQLSR